MTLRSLPELIHYPKITFKGTFQTGRVEGNQYPQGHSSEEEQMDQCLQEAPWHSYGAKKSMRIHPLETQAEERRAHQMSWDSKCKQ